MNSLASPRPLPARHLAAPFASWPASGRPAGFYPAGALDEQAARFYRDQGFLVLENALSAAEIAALNAETVRICRNQSGEVDGIDPAAGDEIDADVLRRILCIHFPHKISRLMRATMSHPPIVDVLTRTLGPNVKAMQSMLFVKASGKPGQAWHQDEFFIPTRDRSLVGGWIALDDATVENGCLWVIPGSNRPGILWEMEEHYDTRFDCAQEARGFPYTDADSVPVEVKAGSVVFFNGYLLHRSLVNRASGGFRRSLVNHYMTAESLLPWKLKQGQQVGSADYRDIVLIAGRDPYAYKGLADEAHAFVRPSGEGGCVSWRKTENLSAVTATAPVMGGGV